MAKQTNKSQSGTNAQEVRQQNAQSAQGAQGSFGTEFGSETDVQSVKKANQQAESRKSQNAGKAGQQ